MLATPKGHQLQAYFSDDLPYLTGDQIKILFEHLPDPSVPGRSGRHAGCAVAASSVVWRPRACPAVVTQRSEPTRSHVEATQQPGLRAALEQVVTHKGDLRKMLRKYRSVPDLYYQGAAPIGPGQLGQKIVLERLGHKTGAPATCWELCAGSGALSTLARKSSVSHLPPIDYRWGFNLSRGTRQLTTPFVFLTVGVRTLFLSPDCFPWGAPSRSWGREKRVQERSKQFLALRFLAVLCFLQVLFGRAYMSGQPNWERLVPRLSDGTSSAVRSASLPNAPRPMRLWS